jgi:hypothetical protein
MLLKLSILHILFLIKDELIKVTKPCAQIGEFTVNPLRITLKVLV